MHKDKWASFSLGLLFVIACILTAAGAKADIRAVERNGLSTKVNGKKGGRCDSGVCRISGGKKAGRNKFLKLREFDTRGRIKGVEIETSGTKNVVLGVTSPVGSYINKGIELSSKANLFWLSPGGIYLGPGAGFVNVPKLNLSTAPLLKFGGGVFDLHESKGSDLAVLSGDPLVGSLGFEGIPYLKNTAADGMVAGIQLEGIDIRIDQELFADALDGALEVRNSKIGVGDEEGAGGSITLTGQSVRLSGTTELSARGTTAGGLIQVGGSWQNNDPSVRQATRSVVETGTVLDVSAGKEGDGGEIVVWSDINNPQSLTIVSGELKARGGADYGNGGRIETSGYTLDVYGIRVDASAENGINGLWLLDPRDITIASNIFSYTSGLIGTRYAGYFADDLSFFDTAVESPDSRFDSPFTSINTTTPGRSLGAFYSVRFVGYFKAPASGQYTFKTVSDDASYLWLGDDSSQSVESFESTITTGNALVDNGGLHGAIEATGTTEFSLSQDSYYPLIVYKGLLGRFK